MSWSDRRAILALAPGLALAACGFAPAYGPGGTAERLRNRILVDEPDTRDAFDLVARIEERLGRAEEPEFALFYRIETRQIGAAVSRTGAITRFNVTGEVAFALSDPGEGRVLTEGRVSNFTAYSATGTTVSTRAAEQDALRRLMRILADQIVASLLATSGTQVP